ncbi:MAG: family RecB-like putative nuclease [Friedmanniella sp.]|nr:family RecB-like putative nuclease [Friedmanniella sp.]
MTAAGILLAPHAARRCAVRTQNDHDPTLRRPVVALSDRLVELFDSGAAFEARVLDTVIARAPGRVVDLRLLAEGDLDTATQACLRTLGSGAEVVLGAVLPVDRSGHRVGRPDLLVRGADRPDGRPGYHVVEVRFHKILDRRRRLDPEDPGVLLTGVDHPAPEHAEPRPGQMLRIMSREADFLELAHHHRMLEACGFAAERPLAAVIGTDEAPEEPVLAWTDLSTPQVRTFSRGAELGWRDRSLLERYDYEQAFRVDVARVARQQTGSELDSPPRLVQPVIVDECGRCPWSSHCRGLLDPEDISLRIDKGPLDVREVLALRRGGIRTISELAHADLTAVGEWYLPQVTHRGGTEKRLQTAARRARLLLAGTTLVRETDGPIEVPAAELEVDFDIESAADGRIYLWGFLVHRRGSSQAPSYREFSSFADLDPPAEAALAEEAMAWLHELVDSSDSSAVFHYSPYEVNAIRTLAERHPLPELGWAAAYAQQSFVDLYEITKTHFFGLDGLGLKVIATQTGFRWRDDDPGGLNSQRWFTEAVHGADPEVRLAAQRRVLEYNEDDVRATHALRAWLRAR